MCPHAQRLLQGYLFESAPYPIAIHSKQSLLNLPGVLYIGATHSKFREEGTGVIGEEALKIKIECVGRFKQESALNASISSPSLMGALDQEVKERLRISKI